MSKYSKLWEFIKNQNADSLKLSYDEIEQIAGKKDLYERKVCGVCT